MGKLTKFKVMFDGDDLDVFGSGQTINGFVQVVLSAPKDDIKSIKIKFKGKAHTHWTEGSGEDEESYSASETYFKEKITCLGKDDSNKRSLDAGEHRFPFSFKIPDIPLPFPFESHVGWIRYKVKCKIDRPGKFDHTTERLFSVTGYPIDLRTVPTAMNPVHDDSSKTVCCLCCATGPINTKACTDKGGYVPGESIFVSGTVENNSNRNIVSLNVTLKQTVKYYSSEGHSTERTNDVIKEEYPGCEEGGVARLDWKPHLIPAIPPTGPQGCKIIKIAYVVHFEGDIENTPFDAEVYLPVVIGTVPVYLPMQANPSAVVTDQPSSSVNAPPPPSYKLAMDGLQEIPSKSGYDYTFGKLMYAPQYPTYNLPTQAPTWDPLYPPTVGDPTYPPGGYPAPVSYPPVAGGPGYPPASDAPAGAPGYPPPAGAPGYPPPSDAPAGAPGYPPPSDAPAGAPGYPPPSNAPVGAPGYPLPSDAPAGAPGYPPPSDAPVGAPAGAPGYPTPSDAPAGAPGYPPPSDAPAGAPGYPLPSDAPAGSPGYPPPVDAPAGAPAGAPGYPTPSDAPAGAPGYPPPSGVEGYPSPVGEEENPPPAATDDIQLSPM